jgi:hypothetical protein
LSAHRLFGIELQADLDLPGAMSGGSTPSDGLVVLRRVDRGALPGWPADGIASWRTRIEGISLTALSTVDGRLAIAWGDDCRFLFDAPARELHWWARDPTDPAWQRLLLDTVSYLVALELGREAMHAAAVVLGGGAIALAAPSDGGKSTLITALLAAGADLLSDDIVVLEPCGAGILAHPGPPLMNVPAARPLPGREVVQAFGAELWTHVPVVDGPRPLEALFLLERRAGVVDCVERLPPSLLPVAPHMLAYPRTRERERRRFELAGQLADTVPMYRLVADSSTPPARLCELILEQGGTTEDVHS